ncbi:type II toxin-antitoxin system VapC family toxin [Larkinella sp.]|uniref:type II toxin-antitoxin system VapC family toxin n=1 Tax=Larkinella sp. TaxID=2034517 RepID=UPI003BABBDC3
MAAGYLSDTNTLIDYLSEKYPTQALEWLDGIYETEAAISVINQIEALGFNFENPEEEQKCLQFVDASVIYPLDDEVVSRTIQLRKQVKIKLPDAIVAATALVHDLQLISRNTADFNKISGLVVINPYELPQS